jgi:hypothetical protein
MLKWPLEDWAKGDAVKFTRIVDDHDRGNPFSVMPVIGIAAELEDGRSISLLFKNDDVRRNFLRVAAKMMCGEFKESDIAVDR